MSNTFVVDGDFLDKLAQHDQLELLRLENNKIIITDKVYAELRRAAADKVESSAAKVVNWLKTNQNEPWLELNAPTPSPELKKGHGERSIVDLINERQATDPSIRYTALTDNSNDVKKLTAKPHSP